MSTVKTSGSQTATLTTEHTLATITDAGTYQLVVDASELVNGETLVLKVYGKARTSDTERLLGQAQFSHAQALPLVADLPRMSPHHYRATLTQTGGTGRAFPWAVYEP